MTCLGAFLETELLQPAPLHPQPLQSHPEFFPGMSTLLSGAYFKAIKIIKQAASMDGIEWILKRRCEASNKLCISWRPQTVPPTYSPKLPHASSPPTSPRPSPSGLSSPSSTTRALCLQTDLNPKCLTFTQLLLT